LLFEFFGKDLADVSGGLGLCSVGKCGESKGALGTRSRGSRIEVVTVAVVHAIGLFVEGIDKP